jgi:glutathione synthase/RimK-type ligase-like ATP-grasp enzyme
MIACLYGKPAAPFVEPVVADLVRAAARRGAEITPVTIEEALAAPRRWREVERLYVLPFDVAARLSPELPGTPAALLRFLFPGAVIFNSLSVHELCWDKIATTFRLLERGVAMPATLVTSDPAEARDFVREHGYAVLKEPRSCAGQGHLVVFTDDQDTVAGEAVGRRYVVRLAAAGERRRLEHGVLTCPPPFYLQRLVGEAGRGGVLRPAQTLRAYIVDGQLVFWTERYRERVRRPADFIVNVVLGARYRLLPDASEAARKLAMRAAEVLGVRIGAVDLVRTGSEGPYVLEVDTDGPHMMIDRSFKGLPEYRQVFDLDDFIAEVLTARAPQAMTRRI